MKELLILSSILFISVACVEKREKKYDEKEVILEYAVKLEEHQNQYDHEFNKNTKENFRPQKKKTKSPMNTSSKTKMKEMQEGWKRGSIMKDIWPIFLLCFLIVIAVLVGNRKE